MAGAASASDEPPLPDLATARCYEDALMMEVSFRFPHTTPKEFVGTPWADSLRAKDEIERAEKRREFLRDCAKAGYRIPDSEQNKAHNKAVYERQNREFERQYEAAVAWAARQRDPKAPMKYAQGLPPIEPTPEEAEMTQCSQSWIQQMGLPGYVRDEVSGFAGRSYRESLAFECGRYGFENARDAAADARNRKVWERINDRIAELKAAGSRQMMRALVGL